MAQSDLIVTVSGAALSLLFYENVRSSQNQIGFLLGNVLLFVTKNVTDLDREIEQKKKQINVTSIVTCPTTDIFYDSKHSINCSKISNYIDDKKKNVVGWFRLRKNGVLDLTLGDKILHKEFANYFASKLNYPADEFIMCLLNNSTNSSKATHRYQYIFLRHRFKYMEPLPLKIHNLADDATSYKPAPISYRNEETDSLSRFIKNHGEELSAKSGVEAVSIIQSTAVNELRSLIPQLCRSERNVSCLESEIKKLQEKIRQSKVNNPSRLSIEHFDKGERRNAEVNIDSYHKASIKNSSSTEVECLEERIHKSQHSKKQRYSSISNKSSPLDSEVICKIEHQRRK